MKNFESAIYEGRIRHRRFNPIERDFGYRIFMIYLDLEEIPRVMKVHPLWSTRRRSPARFRRADYLGDPERPLRDSVLDAVERKTGKRPAGPVRILTHLRYLGLVENPVTFYYCFDRTGTNVEAVLAEVTNNPWRDRHCYVIEANGHPGGVVSGTEDKAMHVSPLMPMDVKYDLRFGTPGAKLPAHIAVSREGSTVFDATLNLTRTEITRQSLGRLLVTYPPMSLTARAGIYLQAAVTWLKGVSYVPKAKPAEDPPLGAGLRGAERPGDLPNDAETGMICPMREGSGEGKAAQNPRQVT